MVKRSSTIWELCLFLKEYKLYWLVPIVGSAILLLGLVAVNMVSGGAAAPFIYTLF